jgi:hypothetical protein
MIHWLLWFRQKQHCAFATSMDPYQPADQFTISLSTCNCFCKPTAWILIRLCRCAGWPGSMLVANALCWFCHGVTQIYHTMIHWILLFTGRTFHIQTDKTRVIKLEYPILKLPCAGVKKDIYLLLLMDFFLSHLNRKRSE